MRLAYFLFFWVVLTGVLSAAETEVDPIGRDGAESTVEARPEGGNASSKDPSGVDARRARIREFWERQGGKNRQEWEKRREELKGLTPEERRAKIRKWREEELGHGKEVRKLTPEERIRKRQEILVRLELEVKALEAKEAEGSLTPAERRRLRHLGELRKRFGDGARTEPGTKGKAAGEKQCGIPCGTGMADGHSRPGVLQQGAWSGLTRI